MIIEPVDAITHATQLEEMVLSADDGDFRAQVEAVRLRGVRVTVVTTIASQPPILSDELRP